MAPPRDMDRAEVAKHAARGSAWILIHNKVYDVTGFLDSHPGGAEKLLEYAGKDGTQAFEEVGHSADALKTREGFLIGQVEGGGAGGKAEEVTLGAAGSAGSSSSVPMLLAFGAAGLAVAGFLFLKFLR